MRTSLALLLGLSIACVEPPDDAAAIDPPPDALARVVGTDNPFGTLSLASTSGWAWNLNGQTTWRTIPQMSALANARAGDSLEADVSVDINSGSTAELRLRVLIDGVIAAPNDVVFRSGGYSHVRSFRFVQNNLSAGTHVVEVQWKGDPGVAITDPTLSVRTAAPSWGEARLVTTYWPDTLSTKTGTAWQDIPGQSMLILTDVPRDLVIAGSFEAESSGGALSVRPLVDGAVVAETQLLPTTAARGARSFVYHVSNVAAGLHTVKFQWSVASGTSRMYDRTMTVYSGPWLGSDGGISGQTTTATTTVTSSAWAPLTEHTVYTYAATEIATLTLSTEATAQGGELWARALVDGVIADPGDVAITTDASGYQAHTLTFQARNIKPGAHQFRIETRFVPTTGSVHTSSIRKRDLAIIHNRRHGVDFASPSVSPRAGWALMQPQHRDYHVVAICFDAKSPVGGGTAPPFVQTDLFNTFVGWDGHKNVYDWFEENTGGRVGVITDAVTTCYQPPCPPFTQGTEACRTDGWYYGAWDPTPDAPQSAEHWRRIAIMQQDALRAADADINFASYDANGDKTLSPDEVVVLLIKPQRTQFGQWGGAQTVAVDGTTLTIPYVDAYATPDDADATNERTPRVGLFAHELSHAILNTADLYGATGLETDSIMSNNNLATHLDPGHKLLNGFLTPNGIEMTEWSTQALTLPAIESSREVLVLHDRSRPTEVFLIENRWVDASNQDGFEISGVSGTAPPQSGINIWRVVLSTNAWGDVVNDRVKRLVAPASPLDGATRYCLKYLDGTPAPLAVVLDGNSPGTGASVGLTLERLANPAACVDHDPPSGPVLGN